MHSLAVRKSRQSVRVVCVEAKCPKHLTCRAGSIRILTFILISFYFWRPRWCWWAVSLLYGHFADLLYTVRWWSDRAVAEVLLVLNKIHVLFALYVDQPNGVVVSETYFWVRLGELLPFRGGNFSGVPYSTTTNPHPTPSIITTLHLSTSCPSHSSQFYIYDIIYMNPIVKKNFVQFISGAINK